MTIAGKYHIVCYMRIEPEDPQPPTYKEALEEKEHLELLQLENIYRVEKIEGE